MNEAPRLVLDTNICLDLWVFDDPLGRPLQRQFAAGRLRMLSDEVCRDEWLRVLAYPRLALAASARSLAIARYDATASMLPAAPRTPKRLPRCADPDDQKFLELAYAGAADLLLSRDRALLRLARRVQREGWLRIQSLAAWHDDFVNLEAGIE